MEPKCETCGAICVLRTVGKGKNVGRKFYTCERCHNFVMWEEEKKECTCGVGQCKVRTAKTVRNKGRKFWCCPQSTGVDNAGCGMFEWVDKNGETTGTNMVIEQTGECSQGSVSTMRTEEIGPVSSMVTQEIGQTSQTQALNTATATTTSPKYLRGYLRGVIRGHVHNSRVFEELLGAIETLDLKNPDERAP